MSNRIMTGGSAFGLKPAFTDKDGWKTWRKAWASLYAELASDIRCRKQAVKALQRAGQAAKQQKMLRHDQIVAWKMMTLLDEAKQRWQRFRKARADLAAQFATFPLDLGECHAIDLHFNKFSLEATDFPKWTIKAKGKTYYIHHITANAPWSTRELEDGPTKGMIRFRKATLAITKDGEAIINVAA